MGAAIAVQLMVAVSLIWARADEPVPTRSDGSSQALATTTSSVAPPAPTSTTQVPVTLPPTERLGLPLPGCPPPPPRARPPGPAPWRPPVLVPEVALPEPVPAPEPVADTSPLSGKGMFVWKYFQSEGGDADAIVRRAVDAGLRQIWIRVGDSRDGFYAADVLAAIVPKAHQAGLSVIGWAFPYLHDPVGDAAWSVEALAWTGPDGSTLDGFSPDIELASEGVVLTERRARVYLGLVRRAAGSRLLVATVYRPSDRLWPSGYPYAAISSYVDAFAPMVYWGCLEPGETVAQTIGRLAPFRPVHPIGQAYSMADDGGRQAAPGAAEVQRFLDVARRSGAVGASFWVWQSATAEQWSAVAGFPWPVQGSDPGG